jgi:hypothetical protein
VSRALLLLGAGAALAGAALLREPPAAGASGLAALGRSLGGWRVLAVDALYLRAEALRARGRGEEVPPIYRAIVALDPGNEAATDALAAMTAAQIRDGSDRGAAAGELEAWWDEAWQMTRDALAERPTSASLAYRAGDLLLEVPRAAPGLAATLDARWGGALERAAHGLAYLVGAARLDDHLRRTGRSHLVLLARAAPREAATALARGATDEQALTLLAAGEELAALHPAALADVEVLGAAPPGGGESPDVPLAEHLAGNARLVRAALAWRAGGPREPFDAALAAQAARESDPENAAVSVLAAWAAAR